MPDTPHPNKPTQEDPRTLRRVEAPQPSEAEVVQALVEVEQATKNLPPEASTPLRDSGTQASWLTGRGAAAFYLFVVFSVILAVGWGVQRGLKILISAAKAPSDNNRGTIAATPAADAVEQANAVRLLERLAAGDRGAANEIAARSADWTGKTQSTERTDQLLNIAFNSNDVSIREASIRAQLALDGIPEDETGLEKLKSAVADPHLRIRAFWMLGALGYRGVDPVHVAKILQSYLGDPDVNVRSWAVNGLMLVATDETVPMLLYLFRNDPSPVVQERAICGLAQSGMYRHAQRMLAAKSLVAWLDDPLLTGQQRTWTFQALRDITGASLGSDSAAWRDWWSKNSKS